MRTHTKLTTAQTTCNTAYAAAPKAVQEAATFGYSTSNRLNLLRSEPKADRGGLSLKAAEALARSLSEVLDAAQDVGIRRRRASLSNLTASTLSERLVKKRSGMVKAAVERPGAHCEFDIAVEGEGNPISYRITRQRRWIGTNKWGTDFWIHRIRLPRGWMTAVSRIGNCEGQLDDGRFVLECIHADSLDMGSGYRSHIF